MLSRLTLKNRILLFTIPLLVTVTLASGVLIKQNYQLWQQATGLKTSIDYFEHVASLINDLQLERGKSSLFLNSGSSNRAELEKQRSKVKEQIENLESIFSRLNPSLVESTTALFQILNENRKFVDSNGKSSEAILKYSELVERLIGLQVSRAREYPLNGIESRLISQSIFEISKENMGRLRATVSGILTKNLPIDTDTEHALDSFESAAVINLKSPGLLISVNTRKQANETIASATWQQASHIVDVIKAKAHEGKYGEDPKAFFENVTKSITIIDEIIDKETLAIDTTVTEVYTHARITFWIYVMALAFGLSLILFLSLKIIRDVTKELNSLSDDLKGAAADTASLAGDISSSSSSLASGVTEQAAALQETVSSLEEVRAMVSKNADNAQQAKTVAVQSSASAQKGKDSVTELVAAIAEILRSNDAIQSQVEQSNNEFTEITRVIGEIASKTKVINEIVFQTKLLSFNASVEAARAGEHGKGFAVVAEEVGNLAQMSGGAAKEIAQLLDGSIKRVETIVKDSKSKVNTLIITGKEKIDLGTATAKHCETALDVVLKGVEDMNLMVAEIATASQEQSQGVDEISKAMNQLEEVTQNNSSATNQVSAVAGQLDETSRKMKEQVSGLLRLTRGTEKAQRAMTVHHEKVLGSSNNVVSLDSARKVKEEKETKTPLMTESPVPFQKAVGAENPPSENDPRFEEV